MAATNPAFSVVVPVYNCAKYLKPCLDSLERQTFADWEAVCVDDGSTDGSGAVLDDYAARDGRFRVIHQVNGGVGAARNAALKAVRGDWIVFLDGDDMLAGHAFELLSRAAGDMPCAEVVCFGLEDVDVGAVSYSPPLPPTGVRVVDVSGKLPNVALSHGFCCRGYRRELVADEEFPRYRTGEDLVFLTRVMLRVKRAGLLPVPLYGYRQFDRTSGGFDWIMDYMDFCEDVLVMLLRTELPVDPAEYRRYLKGATKRVLRTIRGLSGDEAARAWERWWRMASALLACPHLPRAHRWRLCAATTVRSRLLVGLLYRAW